MSSYSLSGENFFGGKNIFQKAGKYLVKASPIASAIKFVANPIKETKAAVKTVARFDPTAKTAKYGNVTKGVLATAALATAAILTGGGALAVAGGIASAAATGGGIAMKPVRTPPKGISPDIIPNVAEATGALPINSFTDTVTTPTTAVRSADSAVIAQYATSAKKPDTMSIVAIACVAASIGALLLFSRKPKLQGVIL
jgi:hypothetical protein